MRPFDDNEEDNQGSQVDPEEEVQEDANEPMEEGVRPIIRKEVNAPSKEAIRQQGQ